MAKNSSDHSYRSRLDNVLNKLKDNNMHVVDVSIKGTSANSSNTYVTYQCIKCGSISNLASIKDLFYRKCKCPKQCYNRIWDYAACLEAAKICNSSSEFRTRFGGAFSAAWEHKWMCDYTWFKTPKPRKSKWDYHTTYKEAQKYNSRYSFSLAAAGAYTIAKKNNWLRDYTWFKKSYQDVQHEDIIVKINQRLESFPDLCFDETEFAHYTVGRNRKIALHCKKHPEEIIVRDLRGFLYGRLPNISYCKKCVAIEQQKYKDIDEMIEELKKYKTLKEARTNNLTLIAHLNRSEEGRLYVKMLDRGNSAWKRGIYSYEFNVFGEIYVYVGLTCNFEKRDHDHRFRQDSSVHEFAVQHNIDIPEMKKETDYIDWDLAREKEIEYMQMYKEQGCILINKAEGGSLGGVKFKKFYTLEDARVDIMQNEYKNIHDISHRNFILYSQILHHINDGDEEWKELLPKPRRNEPNHWTRERVLDIFIRFDSIAEMSRSGYGSAYRAYTRMYRDDKELKDLCAKKFTPTRNKGCRRIGAFDDLGNLIESFNSRFEVPKSLIGYSTLSLALKKQKKARGYFWKYL